MSSMWSIQWESVIWNASFSGCAATACTTPWYGASSLPNRTPFLFTRSHGMPENGALPSGSHVGSKCIMSAWGAGVTCAPIHDPILTASPVLLGAPCMLCTPSSSGA